MRERELLKIIFDSFPDIFTDRESQLIREIASCYGVEQFEVVNCFLDYRWSDIDEKDPDRIIDNFIRRK